MRFVRLIFLLLVPLLAAAPAVVRMSVQAGAPSSAVVRLGARPALEASEIADDVWRGDGRAPSRALAWESLFSASIAAMLEDDALPARPNGWADCVGCKPPLESGLRGARSGRAPPLA
jgi:hypothetical protein